MLIVIPTTILLTLFASWLMGYTINRVSLFALIFSIGILVDDAIVIVENIARHWAMNDGRNRTDAAIAAVAEVGNPTIVATLTIVAALLPMMFVSGLMGPYMSPIPGQRLDRDAVLVLHRGDGDAVATAALRAQQGRGRRPAHGVHGVGAMGRFYAAIARPLLKGRVRSKVFLHHRRRRHARRLHALLHRGRARQTAALRQQVGDPGRARPAAWRDPRGHRPHADDGGRAAQDPARARLDPGLFGNGLALQLQRPRPPLLSARESGAGRSLDQSSAERASASRASHAIALDIRRRLADLPLPDGSALKVVEVPPGPPVLATLLAEVYGPDAETRRATAAKIRKAFESVDFIVDVDDSYGKPSDRLRFSIDQEALEFHGVEEQAVYDTIGALVGGVKVGFSQRGEGLKPIDISVKLPKSAMTLDERLLSTPLPAGGTVRQGANVELGDVVKVTRERASYPIFRHNGRFAEMVSGDVAGRFEAPVYGMLAVQDALAKMDWGPGGPPQIKYHGQPVDESLSDAVVGRRVGGHLCDVPRHGRGLHGGDPRHLSARRRAVRLVPAPARHPGSRAA